MSFLPNTGTRHLASSIASEVAYKKHFYTDFIGFNPQHANARIQRRMWNTTYYTARIPQHSEMSLIDAFILSKEVLFPHRKF